MKNIVYLITALLIISSLSAQNKKLTLYYTDSVKVVDIAGLDSMIIFICGASKVSYEGKDYNTVLIGSQCWLKENLDVGVMIQVSQNAANNGVIEKYCYNNNPANCTTYGGLYQWDEAMQYSTTPGKQGICPPGWHIPTLAEFQTLSSTVGGNGNALKAIGQGGGDGAGTNTSGFSALLAGNRWYGGGYFFDLGNYAYVWSSTRISVYAYYQFLYHYYSYIHFVYDEKGNGNSVRCIKD